MNFIVECVIGSGFLAAMIMDVREKCVYRFLWGIPSAGILFLFCQHPLCASEVLTILFYAVFQEALLSNLYGKADCHCFTISGAYLAVYYGGESLLYAILMHMILTFLLLCVVAALQKNIHSTGELRRHVAFVPYIVIALYLECWLF